MKVQYLKRYYTLFKLQRRTFITSLLFILISVSSCNYQPVCAVYAKTDEPEKESVDI